jgi:hypothetical protein
MTKKRIKGEGLENFRERQAYMLIEILISELGTASRRLRDYRDESWADGIDLMTQRAQQNQADIFDDLLEETES